MDIIPRTLFMGGQRYAVTKICSLTTRHPLTPPSRSRPLIPFRRGHLELLGAMEAEVQRSEAEILSSGGSLPQLKVRAKGAPMSDSMRHPVHRGKHGPWDNR